MANGKTQRQGVSFLWGIATLIILISMVFALCACGGSDDDEEETTSSTTPRLTATVSTTTPEPITSTPEPTTTTTSEPTPTASTTTPETTTQTPTEDPNDPEVALKGMLNSLVVLFAQIGGQWEAYAGPNTVPLTMLQQGQIYWFYATTDVAPTWALPPLHAKWQAVVWNGQSSASVTALSGYENTVLFVISPDTSSGKTYLYQSPEVTALSVLQPGQTYQRFLQEPGNRSAMGEPSQYTH